MKKLIFSAGLILSLGLAACGGNEEESTSTEEPKEVEAEQQTEAAEPEAQAEEKTDEETTEEEVTESELGKLTVNYKNKELAMTQATGPVNLTLNAVQLSTLEVAEDYKEMFDNQDVVTVVTINMTAENTVEDTVSFYPDQATIVTDTGQQVEADLVLSGDVGGDFLGKVKLEDDVIWILKHDENIKNLKLHVGGPSDSNFDSLAEDFVLDIPIQ